MKQRVMQTLNMKGGSAKLVRDVVREYAGNLGETGESVDQDYLLSLVDKF